MIYKMQLSDSVDTMISELLEVPIEGKDITGIADNTTIDGNVFRDYLWLKKQWTQRWSIMCQDEYERLRGFWTRQFGNAEVPLYRLFYGDNVYEDKNTFTVNGFVQIENDAPLYSPLSLTNLYGNATQETIQPLNLFDVFDTTGGQVQDVSVDADGWLTCTINNTSGTGTKYGLYLTNNLAQLQTSTTYAIVMEVKAKSGTGNIYPTQGSGAQSQMTSNKVYNFSSISAGQTYIFTQATKSSFAGTNQGLRTVVAFSAGQSGSITFRLSVLADTSITPQTFSYLPFVGSSPSPNPSYPQDVNVVSGAQTVKITGKNLFDITDVSRAPNSSTQMTIADGVITLEAIGTSGAQYVGYIVSGLDSTKAYTISTKAKKGVLGTDGRPIIQIALYGSNDGSTWTGRGQIAENNPVQGTEYSLSRTMTGYTHYRFYIYNNTNTPVTVGEQTQYYDIQFEEGSTATAYEPYQSQSQEINLGSLELAKIGTYQDYIWNDGGTWKIHKEVGKVVLTGASSEAWAIYSSNKAFRTQPTNMARSATATTVASIMSDNFVASTEALVYTGGVDYGLASASSNDALMLCNKDITTVVGLETWLSTHNTTVYYALATPTDTEITDSELIEQLDHIYSLYSGVNNLWLIPSGGAQGEIGVKYLLNYEEETDIVPSTPVVLTLSDGGVINTCGCRQNIQLIMRETTQGDSES